MFGRPRTPLEPPTDAPNGAELRELRHALEVQGDEIRFLRDRFDNLQRKLMTDVRDLRKEIAAFEPELYDEEEDEPPGR
jgi:hypothetical protein